MIVFLSELDTYEIAWAASGRCQFKKDAGIKNSKRVDQQRDDYQITREGLTGEWAVGQTLGLPVNLENYLGGDPGWDFEYKGLKVDVKTTRAKLLLFQNLDKFVADVAVLVRYVRDDLVQIVGIISKDKFKQNCQIRNLGYQDNYTISEDKLSPIEDLINYEPCNKAAAY
jgi:hypothetical protein